MCFVSIRFFFFQVSSHHVSGVQNRMSSIFRVVKQVLSTELMPIIAPDFSQFNQMATVSAQKRKNSHQASPMVAPPQLRLFNKGPI